jgi:hypothetical protein
MGQNKPITQISDELKTKIIERYRFYPLNSIPQLASEFKCSQGKINLVINNYLASKIR